MIAALLVNMFLPVISSALVSIQRGWEQKANQIIPNQQLDIFTLTDLMIKGYINDDLMTESMEKQGYSSSLAQFLIWNSYNPIPIADAISGWRRGILNDAQLEKMLNRNKVWSHDIEDLKQITEYFPSPPDLVRFAVREVYTPKTREYFGMDEDITDEYLREAWKAGLPIDQARNYWAAHWELPSPNMGFEMFHRRIIDEDELKLLLKSLDVMPFWRDKLIQLSYNPLTRVDVRRMYGLGVLNKQDVYNSYLDLGYSPENAERMTDFTIAYENDEVNGLTRSTVINAYKDSLISREQCIQYLSAFRYTEDVVNFYMDIADYEKSLEEMEKYSNDLLELWTMGAITIEEMRQVLNGLDLPSTYIDNIINKTILTKSRKTKVPSKEDLTDWLNEGMIDELYYTQKMRLLGFNDTDIQLYMSQIATGRDISHRRYLKVEDYIRWYKKKIMNENDFIETLTKMGLGIDDIETIIIESQEVQNESNE